jgi:putative transposase
MNAIDKIYITKPFYGCPRITDELRERGYHVNRKRVARLMRLMGIHAITPGPHTRHTRREHTVYPYLLKGLNIERPNHVWCADITYIPMRRGFLYLVAVMDWHSRYVLRWELSNTLDATFCLTALDASLQTCRPEIFNTDQGAQFTCDAFIHRLKASDVRISMDGRGRAMDNIFIERLWWTLKYEDIYVKEYADGISLHKGLTDYFTYYNYERRHGSLGKKTPAAMYFS